MTVKDPKPCASSPSQLLDALVDRYVTWREESAAVTETYRNWGRASRDGRAAAYVAYVWALEREEHAARAYQCLVEQAAAA
jgi:hypothetical protein